MKRLTVVLLFAFGLLFSSSAWAACPISDRPVVVLVLWVKPPDQLIADHLRQHLEASLDDRGIDLCLDSSAPRRPVGRILLEVIREGGSPVTARIQIGDHITDKKVERTMDLSVIPVDTRPLAVSASADELLRASWAELLLSDAPAPAMAPPKEIMTSVTSSLEPRRFQLGLLGTGTWFAKLSSFGAALHFGYLVNDRVSLALRGQFGASLKSESTNGSTSLSQAGGQLVGGYAFWPFSGPATLAWELGLEVDRVQIVGTPSQEESAQTRALDWTLAAFSGPRGLLAVGERFQLTLGTMAVYSLRPVAATDDGEPVLSNSGFGAQVSLGAMALF